MINITYSHAFGGMVKNFATDLFQGLLRWGGNNTPTQETVQWQPKFQQEPLEVWELDLGKIFWQKLLDGWEARERTERPGNRLRAINQERRKRHLMSSGNEKEGVSHDTFEGRLDKMVLFITLYTFIPPWEGGGIFAIHSCNTCSLGPAYVRGTFASARDNAKTQANAMSLPSLPSGRRQEVNKQTNNVIPDSTRFVLLVSNVRNLVGQ